MIPGIVTFSAAILGGWLVSLLDIPLGWLVGAMLAIVGLSLFKAPVQKPDRAMPVVKASVGTMLGAGFGIDVISSLGAWWPSFLFMIVVMFTGGVVNFQLMRRLFGFGKSEAALCSVPGGIAEMILLSETAGAEQWRVAIVHALRIALAILFIPLLIGFITDAEVARAADAVAPSMSIEDWGWFGLCVAAGVSLSRFKLIPAQLILVPMILSSGLHLTGVSNFAVPTQISNLIQIMIGVNVGSRFAGIAFKLLVQVGLAAVVVVAVQITLAFAAAVVVSNLLGVNPVALALAYSPGGLAEMSLIAVAMGQEVAVVGVHHICRVLGALFAAPAILKRVNRADG